MKHLFCSWPLELFLRPDWHSLRVSFYLPPRSAKLEASCEIDQKGQGPHAKHLLGVPDLSSVRASWRVKDEAPDILEMMVSLEPEQFLLSAWAWTEQGCTYEILVSDPKALEKHQGPAILQALADWPKLWETLTARIHHNNKEKTRAIFRRALKNTNEWRESHPFTPAPKPAPRRGRKPKAKK